MLCINSDEKSNKTCHRLRDHKKKEMIVAPVTHVQQNLNELYDSIGCVRDSKMSIILM